MSHESWLDCSSDNTNNKKLWKKLWKNCEKKWEIIKGFLWLENSWVGKKKYSTIPSLCLEMIIFTLQSRNSEWKLTKTYSVSHVCVVAVHLKKSYYVCVRDACMHTKSCKGNILRMLSRLAWGLKFILKGVSLFSCIQ